MVVMLSLGETRAGDLFAADHLESGQTAAVTLKSSSDFYGASEYDASGYAVAVKSIGETVVRTTRGGDKGARITRPDGSVIDITPGRVKEFVPNIHPQAPPGSLQKVKFDNAIEGSKGSKRPPTQQELDIFKNAK